MAKEDTYAATEGKEIEAETGIGQNFNAVPFKTKPWWKLGGKDYSFVPVDSGYTHTVEANKSDSTLDSVRDMGRHVYENDEAKDIYKPIEGYEGAHRFNPHLKWDPDEEKRLVKTVRTSSPANRSSLTCRTARLANCFAGMHYVLCASTGSWKYHSSDCRHYAE